MLSDVCFKLNNIWNSYINSRYVEGGMGSINSQVIGKAASEAGATIVTNAEVYYSGVTFNPQDMSSSLLNSKYNIFFMTLLSFFFVYCWNVIIILTFILCLMLLCGVGPWEKESLGDSEIVTNVFHLQILITTTLPMSCFKTDSIVLFIL